jgi:hypothetical protein
MGYMVAFTRKMACWVSGTLAELPAGVYVIWMRPI